MHIHSMRFQFFVALEIRCLQLFGTMVGVQGDEGLDAVLTLCDFQPKFISEKK